MENENVEKRFNDLISKLDKLEDQDSPLDDEELKKELIDAVCGLFKPVRSESS